jgi:hypothetical protein
LLDIVDDDPFWASSETLNPIPPALHNRRSIPRTFTTKHLHGRHRSTLPGDDQFITLANVQPVEAVVDKGRVSRRTIQPDDDGRRPGRRRDEIELQGVELGHGAVGID